MSMLARKNSADTYNVPVMEGYDVEVAGDSYAYEEFMQDMVGVFESMHECDMMEVEARKNNGNIALESFTPEMTNDLEVVQESAFNSTMTRLKSALQKLWGKIKGFFASMRKYFDVLFMSAKDFGKKYKTQIIQAAAKADGDFEFKCYDYNNASIDNPNRIHLFDKAADLINKFTDIEKADSDKLDKDLYGPYRRAIVGDSDADDFSKNIFAYFRNGANDANDKKEIKAADIKSCLDVIMGNTAEKELTTMEKAMNKSFTEMMKKLTDVEKDLAKGDTDNSTLISRASKENTAFGKCQSIATTYIRGWHTVIKERQNAYKSACMAVMTYRNKKA